MSARASDWRCRGASRRRMARSSNRRCSVNKSETDRRHRPARRYLEGRGRPRPRRDRRRDQDVLAPRGHRHARRLRIVLCRQAQPARRPQPRTGDAIRIQGRRRCRISRWKSVEGCAKLAPLTALRVAGSYGPLKFGALLHRVSGWLARSHRSSGCLAQLVERRPYKANVGGSIPSAPTRARCSARRALIGR